MAVVRSQLRVFATTWLIVQALSLAALMPRDCCAAHRPAANRPAAPACHESSHRPAVDCRLTGGCSGPMSALVRLLSYSGILPDRGAALPHAAVRPVDAAGQDDVIGRYDPPDAPPPRA